MKDYLNGRWRSLLAYNGLDGFDALWALELPWFEAPNQRRGGWSGVARCELHDAEGHRHAFFLKRQENHGTFSWRHPFKGMPTFEREFRLIRRYQAGSIPALTPAYYASRFTATGHRAILMTEALDGYRPLDEVVPGPKLPTAVRRNLLRTVALLTRKIHDCHIQHNCYYPKHVFVRIEPDQSVTAHAIDLEKSRWRPMKFLCTLRDLDTLNRYSLGWTMADRVRFFKYYLRMEHLTPYAKWLWRRLAAQALKKNHS